MASSSLNPSPYELLETNEGFGFITDTGQAYIIYFTDGSVYFLGQPFAEHVFTFGFTPVNNSSDPIKEFIPIKKDKQNRNIIDHDDRISATVALTIQLFFRDDRNILIYVCDHEDGRQFARNKLFDIWYRKYKDQSIVKQQFVNENEICSSLLYKATNPFREELEECLPEAVMKIKLNLN